MSSGCDATRAALEDAFLERRPPAAEARAHLDSCVACRAVEAELASLARGLGALPAAAPSEPLVAGTLLRAREELTSGLAGSRRGAVSAQVLPPGFVRELVRLLAIALAALPAVLAWNAVVIRFGGELLARLLPEPLLGVVAGAYLASVAGWLAFLYGSIPFVAHRRVRRTTSEVTG